MKNPPEPQQTDSPLRGALADRVAATRPDSAMAGPDVDPAEYGVYRSDVTGVDFSNPKITDFQTPLKIKSLNLSP